MLLQTSSIRDFTVAKSLFPSTSVVTSEDIYTISQSYKLLTFSLNCNRLANVFFINNGNKSGSTRGNFFFCNFLINDISVSKHIALKPRSAVATAVLMPRWLIPANPTIGSMLLLLLNYFRVFLILDATKYQQKD